jgi:hypothetical protein
MTTIMANVSQRILSKAGHMFSNSLTDIFVELFQNARRAGASQIDTLLRTVENGKAEITVTDNGSGIMDFSSLLCLGDSNWDAATDRAEDAAGSGVGRWGNGDVEVALDSIDDLPYVIGLVRQSFEKQMGSPADG